MEPDTRIPLRTGREIPVLGLGTWELVNDTPETVEAALEAGYRMIDTATDYGSQPGIGRALAGGAVPRDRVYVVTKIEETDDPMEGARRDLGELGLDCADLTLLHRPPRDGTAGEALWEGLLRLREAGLARDVGVSNYGPAAIDRLTQATGEAPAVNQIEWTPFGHDPDLRDHHREAGIVLMAYSPLTRGERLGDVTLGEIARRHGRTPAQVLIRWSLQSGAVPIPKANRMDHCHENLDVFGFALEPADMARLDALNAHWSALGSLPYLGQKG